MDENVVKEGATGKNLFDILIDSFKNYNISFDNVIGFGSDGCNVMMGRDNSVSSRMREMFPGITVNFCICHSLHLCASKACKTLPRACEDLVRNIYNHFSHSCKRKAHFQEFQKLAEVEIHRLLYPAQTRWLSVTAAVVRIVEQWLPLQLYFENRQWEERLLSVEAIYRDLQSPLIKLLFLFLCWVLPKVTTLNSYFQHEKEVVTDVDPKMRCVYKELLRAFLDKDYVNQTPIHLIDPGNNNKFISTKSMYFGFEVMKMLQQEDISCNKALVEDFHGYCRNFLVTLCRSIRKRYSFEDELLIEIACLSPRNALSENFRIKHPSLFKLIQCVLRISAFFADKLQDIDDEWRKLPYMELPEDIMKCEDVDKFWFQLLKLKDCGGETVFSSLPLFALYTLAIPHSNSACEVVFSKVNLTKVKLRNRLAVRTVDACVSANQYVKGTGNCYNVMPTEEMLAEMNSLNLYQKTEEQDEDLEDSIFQDDV